MAHPLGQQQGRPERAGDDRRVRGRRGEFYNQETFNGRAIFVRFIFSDTTPTSFRLEQAFSADGGASWEPNWIATFAR